MLIRPLWIECMILLYEYVLVTKKINILNFLNVYSVPSTGNSGLEKLIYFQMSQHGTQVSLISKPLLLILSPWCFCIL